MSTIATAAAIPDSRLARAITEYIRDNETELLFNHSSRVYHFGALAGVQRGLQFDRELLYAGDIAVHHKRAISLRSEWGKARWFLYIRNRLYIGRKCGTANTGANASANGSSLTAGATVSGKGGASYIGAAGGGGGA